MNEETLKLLETYDSDITKLDISNSNIEGILDLSKFENLKITYKQEF